MNETVTLCSMHIHTFTAMAFLSVVSICSWGCSAAPGRPSVVKIVETDSGYQLLKNGEPYTILGVGGSGDLEKLKSYGGNTVRTWDAEGIGPMMDEADKLGISVVVGIWLEHQRHGFDFNDPESRAAQRARVEGFVKEFKDHPALLAWGVGNELELGGEMGPAVEQINEAARVIKSLDKNHPTMAVIAEIGDEKAITVQRECPEIDMLGINAYGGMGDLATRVKRQGYTGPYAITEFGVVGHWETGLSPWGAPYEQSSSEKASFIRNNYRQTIEPNLGKQCLGSFAFLWGSKQEKTATWYGLLLSTGETTERVDVLSEFWTGQAPENRAPRVSGIDLKAGEEAGKLAPGQRVHVHVEAKDLDRDKLETTWEVIPESAVKSAGGDYEKKLEAIDLPIETISATRAVITLPDEPGAYRIFVTVRDGRGHAGTANMPILIGEN